MAVGTLARGPGWRPAKITMAMPKNVKTQADEAWRGIVPTTNGCSRLLHRVRDFGFTILVPQLEFADWLRLQYIYAGLFLSYSPRLASGLSGGFNTLHKLKRPMLGRTLISSW